MKCNHCYVDMEIKRSSKKYCGATCRQRAYRDSCSVTLSKDVTLTVSTPVTLSPDNAARLGGYLDWEDCRTSLGWKAGSRVVRECGGGFN